MEEPDQNAVRSPGGSQSTPADTDDNVADVYADDFEDDSEAEV